MAELFTLQVGKKYDYQTAGDAFIKTTDGKVMLQHSGTFEGFVLVGVGQTIPFLSFTNATGQVWAVALSAVVEISEVPAPVMVGVDPAAMSAARSASPLPVEVAAN